MPSFRFALPPALILLAAAPLLGAQSAPASPALAPVPAPILTGQKVFLANAGTDAYVIQLLGYAQMQPTETYDAFYAGLQSWGRYQLVSSPAGADLVFEIHTVEQQTGCGVGTADFQIVLDLYDAHTHFVLWSLTQPIQLANLKSTWRKNILAANDNLLAQLKSLLIPAPPVRP
jgi:hypothetical protein